MAGLMVARMAVMKVDSMEPYLAVLMGSYLASMKAALLAKKTVVQWAVKKVYY